MEPLITVRSESDIPPSYRGTPIAKLLEYHDLERPFDTYDKAELLVGMCMDNRKHLRIPDNFSFIIRSGGGSMRFSEFKVSYAIAIAGVKHIALLGHTGCGMVHLVDRKEQFIQGLVETAGWLRPRAEAHFLEYAPIFEIGNEVEFILAETKRLRLVYPKIMVAPMLYRVEDNRIYPIREDE